jgi:chromosome segregation ATPase
MADDDGAKARLEAAVQRLEIALGQVSERDSGVGADVSQLRLEVEQRDSELSTLRAERDQLAETLSDTQAEAASLQDAMDAVSTRLDSAISSVHALLEE